MLNDTDRKDDFVDSLKSVITALGPVAVISFLGCALEETGNVGIARRVRNVEKACRSEPQIRAPRGNV